MRISDWSSDVCSSDLDAAEHYLAVVAVAETVVPARAYRQLAEPQFRARCAEQRVEADDDMARIVAALQAEAEIDAAEQMFRVRRIGRGVHASDRAAVGDGREHGAGTGRGRGASGRKCAILAIRAPLTQRGLFASGRRERRRVGEECV